jgi:flavin-binding protein dodecin
MPSLGRRQQRLRLVLAGARSERQSVDLCGNSRVGPAAGGTQLRRRRTPASTEAREAPHVLDRVPEELGSLARALRREAVDARRAPFTAGDHADDDLVAEQRRAAGGARSALAAVNGCDHGLCVDRHLDDMLPAGAGKCTPRRWRHEVGACIAAGSCDTRDMSDHVYKILELVGSSPNGIEHAVENALSRAAKTVRSMRWFEVVETRGHIEDGKVAHWQVKLKIGFTLES